ncbi:hypothetical protein ASPCAL08616 [Aspergillus calidoustus]|uniref:Proteophosphoglycan ppg4 n=1 Tax=Aspergillus calidoustus TaxID=454130 RepID=A0A0U5GQQ5_ASPCI|nr:hypothetical protein ASPCAL08616 [Aspergillus calidoustus]
MAKMHSLPAALLALSTIQTAAAHTVAWARGMYCLGGPDITSENLNTNTAVDPLYNLTQSDWWFQHHRGCDAVPPAEGDILELPAGGSFTVELAHNRAFTTLSYDGEFTTEWPDGEEHPEDWNGTSEGEGCIEDDGALHTTNQTGAAGTAWAISYTSELKEVTMENLVVFSVLEHTPWKRLATYEVPQHLPACPKGGCTCAWLWVPKGCGQPNIYMAGYKCNVTDVTSTKQLAPAQPPVYCEDDSSKCVAGAKQMIAWNQATGNNIEAPAGKTPMYNEVCGFKSGPQNDIFVQDDTKQETVISTEPVLTATSEPVTSSVSVSLPASASSSVSTSVSSSATACPPQPTATTTRRPHNHHHHRPGGHHH